MHFGPKRGNQHGIGVKSAPDDQHALTHQRVLTHQAIHLPVLVPPPLTLYNFVIHRLVYQSLMLRRIGLVVVEFPQLSFSQIFH